MKNENHFGKKLLEIRRAAGLTQVKLAKYFKRKQPLISQYEKGAIQPSATILALYLKLAKKHSIKFSLSDL
jgi:transcriptional regulator with XRE-family HTH domain